MENDTSSESEVNREFRCDPEQYAMLKRCSEKRNMTEWNEWWKAKVRLEGAKFEGAHLDGADLWGAHLKGAYFWEAHLEGADLREARLEGANLYRARLKKAGLLEAHLEGADLRGAHLKGAELWKAHLEGAKLGWAHLERVGLLEAHLEGAELREANLEKAKLRGARLEGAELYRSNLEEADLGGAHLEGAEFKRAHLEGADFTAAVVDGATLIWNCEIDRATNFTGVGLESARVAPGLKRTLKDNIRRIGWENWYNTGSWWVKFLKRLFVWPFWLISDHGRSTGRIIAVFFALAAVFGFVYWACPETVMVRGEVGAIRGPLHALYFSVVTMTTLGFGDIHANPDSAYGQFLLMVQVIFGYVLLGALVTRFAVLFSGEGPAREFAKKEKRKRAPKSQQKEDGAGKGAENSKP